jgi:hypothetical protein
MIFLFFITVLTAMAVPSPDSYRWGGGGDGGRTTEAFVAKEHRLGLTGESGAKGRPLAVEAASSVF